LGSGGFQELGTGLLMDTDKTDFFGGVGYTGFQRVG
jgi:hypothetical protein